MFDSSGESTPPTKEQTFSIFPAVEEKGEVDSVGNSDLSGFNFNVIDGGADDFPAGVPVGCVRASGEPHGAVYRRFRLLIF
jgi:hypothetical protein